MTNVSQLDIEQIEGLIRSIKGMNDDNYQDTWVAILERGTLDKNEIERVAKNIVAEAIQNAKHERCKLVHLAIEKMDLKIANPIYKPRRRLIFRYIDIKCVHCGSYEVAKYGCYKGIQRYYCFTCSRKFRDGMNLKKH
ncbi:MAG TPA: hypothetical protein VMW86_06400, partial [Dehalococcoidales bacterium]|nr:hypothetical protein [Dehalococcoidales bacterium]